MPQLAPLIYLSLGGQFEADGKGSICPIIPGVKKLACKLFFCLFCIILSLNIKYD